jgi:alpha-tubulin suppressor-like RCC1 family protein
MLSVIRKMADPHNLLLIDSSIPDVDTFVNGLNSNSHGVLYSIEDSFESLKEKIAALHISNFDNVALVFVDEHSPLKMFVSYNTFISFNETGIIENNTTAFLKEIVDTYNVKNLDFLACNLLSYSEWKSYFEYLMAQNSGLVVRASEDRSGNLEAGGDWVLESTYEDVTHLYFNDAIGQWNYLLDLGFHSAVLGIDGAVYTCGSNSSGQLGRPLTLFQNFIDISANPITDITAIATGSNHTVILRNNGEVWACGAGTSGQLGNGTNTNQIQFVRSTFFIDGSSGEFSNISDATAIAAGGIHTVIIRGLSGEVWACGLGTSGQLGDGTNTSRDRFVLSKDLNGDISGATAIAAGGSHTVILRGLSGEVLACGLGTSGQLGDGTNTTRDRFVRSKNSSSVDISGATAIAAGTNHTVILRGLSGEVLACGQGTNGRLGNGGTANQGLFVNSKDSTLADISGAIAIAAGDAHTVILRGLSGEVLACGLGTSGQLGDGTNTTRDRFVRSKDLNGDISGATAIAAGDNHTVILRGLSGEVLACGLGTSGRLGDGTNTSRDRFVRSKNSSSVDISGATAIAAGTQNTVILRGNGELMGCGSNASGQLGLIHALFIPAFDENITNIVSVATATNNTVILRNNGEVWACGINTNGQLGNGTNTGQDRFVRSTFFINGINDISGNTPISDATAIAAGANHTVIIRNNGEVWACGQGANGRLGNGGTTNQNRFVRSTFFINGIDDISGNTSISDATAIAAGGSHTVIIRQVGIDRQVWACGLGTSGQLGWSFFADRIRFVRSKDSIGDISDVTAIAAGTNHTVIIRGLSGEVLACGSGLNGRLGNGGTASQGVFVNSKNSSSQDISGAIAIAAGDTHTVILRGLSGEVLACGTGTSGQLGDGLNTNQLQFVNSKNSSSQDISGAIAIATGSNHTYIIRNNGDVWACGSGFSGQLGNGVLLNQNQFVQSILAQNIRAKYRGASTKNPNVSGFTDLNLNLNNAVVFFPDMVSNSIASSDVTQTSQTFVSLGLTATTILKLEPANTVFSDYISFDISGVTASHKVYFKSETDEAPVELAINADTNNYGAYYTFVGESTIRVFTKHFTEAVTGTEGGGEVPNPPTIFIRPKPTATSITCTVMASDPNISSYNFLLTNNTTNSVVEYSFPPIPSLGWNKYTISGLITSVAYDTEIYQINNSTLSSITTNFRNVVTGDKPSIVNDLSGSVDFETNTITLNWSAPTTDGGAPVFWNVIRNLSEGTKYNVPGSITTFTTSIGAGGMQTFSVEAVNDPGYGPRSSVELNTSQP